MRLRITLIISLMASIGMLALTCFVLRPQIEGLRRQRTELIKQRDQHYQTAEQARAQLGDAIARRAELEQEIREARKQFEIVAAENDILQQTNRRALHDLENARTELLSKSRRLAEWDGLGLIPGQVLALISSNQSLRLTVNNLTQRNEKISRDYAELKKKSEQTEDAPPELPPVVGKILALDPKWNFVVLNIGENQGLKANGVLLVARNSELLGKLRITRVEADQSIADLLPDADIATIREGDHVFN